MKQQYGYYVVILCVLLLLHNPCRANSKLQIEGINNHTLQRNLRTCLSNISSENEIITSTRFHNKVNKIVRKCLRAFGYYEPTITFKFKKSSNNNQDILIIHINSGKPVKIADINVTLHGEAKQDNDYLEWVKKGKLTLGKVLNHYDYDKFKDGFSILALQKGYFDAIFRKSQLSVVPSIYQSYWNIDFDSGQRYHFGEFRIHGSQIRNDYLYNLANIKIGDPYHAESLAILNNRLAATNWFNSIVISTNLSSDQESCALILDTVVTPRTRNGIEVGIGYTTDIGPRATTTWNKPWLNSRGHSFQTSLSLSELEQTADLHYKIHLVKDPFEQYYLLQVGLKRENLNHSQSYSNILNIARYWNFSHNWQKILNFRWSLNHFIQNEFTDTTMLIYPSISLNRTRQKDGLMPMWGDSQLYSIDISHTVLGSNINFIIFKVQTVWIRPLTEKHRFIARGNFGWIETNNFERIPPLLRFFAGGDRSIRGYKYKSLSSWRNSEKPTGASKLGIGSLEYQYNILGKWWSAMFIDSGEAADHIKWNNFKTGAGIGIRWQSIIGPIKLDMAAPMTEQYKFGIHFYIGLGSEL
ncbi:autotransporter assembly complex family protein [Candidatus Curculioniphilus buchneri]|uniref:autotransporter assembly complex protein TamA n=1 Tax=Candidatus Curculioniphilus buchneri TaxID=690594 RepID=UPI00376EDB83